MSVASYARRTMEAVEEPSLEALRAEGAEREAAVRSLHALLLRAARFELSRRRAATATRAPCAASWSAVASPMPELAPVIATRLVSLTQRR